MSTLKPIEMQREEAYSSCGHRISLMTLANIVRAARVEPQMVDLMKELSKSEWLPP